MNTNIRFITFAIFVRDKKILLYKVQDDFTKEFFLRPIGGGIEFYEHSNDALKRELKEEIGFNITNISELCILENLLIINNEKTHNIYKGYLADFEDVEVYNKKNIKVKDTKNREFIAKWFNIQEVLNSEFTLLPIGLKEIIEKL
jgi:ADP-ribose pyrophosphatase YjhB (NUDIX family)